MSDPLGNHQQELPALSFPPGELADTSVRIPLLYNDADFFVVSKPAGVRVRQHPWEPGGNLDRALNNALQQQKQWAQALEAAVIGSVFPLDQAISGPVLFAKHSEALARARNAFGSYRFEFKFWLIAQAKDAALEKSELSCDMPLRAVDAEAKLLPSRRRGKRCETHFKQLHTARNGWSLWQATSLYPRLHQVRAHARCMGLAIAADSHYGTALAPTANDLCGGGRGAGLQKPLLVQPALHLHALNLAGLMSEEAQLQVNAPAPAELRNCLRKAGWVVERSVEVL